MKILVEQITNDSGVEAIMRIRHQVFERELGIKLAHLSSPDNRNATYLLARAGADEEPVGCLCVLDTSGDDELHAEFGLKFGPRARVARYTHLAVLTPYRGMNVPLALMVKAHHSVIVPFEFDYTWLLFDAERAGDSFLSRRLCFKPLPETFVSEYGCRCPLVRDERSPYARQAIRQSEEHLRMFQTHSMGRAVAEEKHLVSYKLSQRR
jgi:hypothetical protein